MNKIRWGVLSTAKFGREKMIPALQKSQYAEVRAIASRSIEDAKQRSGELGIPTYYEGYEKVLEDENIDAVYIPLPNHLHVQWAIKALKAGKHVLCEKPIALSASEAQSLLIAARQTPHLKIMEAFMYRFHPQWQKAKALIASGMIGTLKSIHAHFSYYNTDPHNIRNQPEIGGGGMMDIGCYCISLSRFIFKGEPGKVAGMLEYDPALGTDRMASALLQFPGGVASFTCSTQMMPYQKVNILGTSGRIEIEIPFNTPPDKETRLHIFTKDKVEEVVFEAVDQYTIQCDAFSKAILNNTEVPEPLEDAVHNMKVIEAVFKAAKEERWIAV
jgi:predicted dehydrogenase